MKKYKSLFASGLSLSLTVFLLIFTVYAWYISNEEVNISSISASTESLKNVYISEEYESGDISSSADLEKYNFSNRINISYDGFLSPVSSYDASNYYIPKTIASNGTATEDDGFSKLDSSTGYYISKNLSFCSFEAEDISLSLANISIQASDSSTLYKAVRVSLSSSIYKCCDGGDAYPVYDSSTISSTDPAIDSGNQSDTFTIDLAAFDETATVVSVVLNIWIEGQNEYAVSANDLSSFNVKMSFED